MVESSQKLSVNSVIYCKLEFENDQYFATITLEKRN